MGARRPLSHEARLSPGEVGHDADGPGAKVTRETKRRSGACGKQEIGERYGPALRVLELLPLRERTAADRQRKDSEVRITAAHTTLSGGRFRIAGGVRTRPLRAGRPRLCPRGGHRQAAEPDARGGSGFLVLGNGGGVAAHRHPDRGVAGPEVVRILLLGAAAAQQAMVRPCCNRPYSRPNAARELDSRRAGGALPATCSSGRSPPGWRSAPASTSTAICSDRP